MVADDATPSGGSGEDAKATRRAEADRIVQALGEVSPGGLRRRDLAKRVGARRWGPGRLSGALRPAIARAWRARSASASTSWPGRTRVADRRRAARPARLLALPPLGRGGLRSELVLAAAGLADAAVGDRLASAAAKRPGPHWPALTRLVSSSRRARPPASRSASTSWSISRRRSAGRSAAPGSGHVRRTGGLGRLGEALAVAAAAALAAADQGWLERLVTRRVPLDRWAEALDRRPDDVKAVVDLTR